MPTFRHVSQIPVPAEQVFDWHARSGAFQRLAPPWQAIELVQGGDSLAIGTRAEISMRLGPFRRTWVAEHTSLIEGCEFQDVQVSGPFTAWKHTHRMVPQDDGTCDLDDSVEYRLPLGWWGELVAGRFARRQLERMFRYRHRTTIDDLRQHQQAQRQQAQRNGLMKILVSGSSGLVGSALVPFLTTGGHEVVRLARNTHGAGVVGWFPSQGKLDPAAIEGFDAVVHLAGENIGEGRWTEAKKQKIRDSRVQGTRLLAETLAKLQHPPRVLVSASAIGYYGDRGAEVLTEESPPSDDFLGTVCQEWEAATEPARAAGIRVVHLRTGIVLSSAGGALAKMLLPFKLCVGGIVGPGNQYWSWIALDDLLGIILHALTNEAIQGPLNAVAPRAVTNREFTETLGKVLRRPTAFPLPAFAARAVLGEMADSLLLASTCVRPEKLLRSGYEFRFPELEPALRHTLGRA